MSRDASLGLHICRLGVDTGTPKPHRPASQGACAGRMETFAKPLVFNLIREILSVARLLVRKREQDCHQVSLLQLRISPSSYVVNLQNPQRHASRGPEKPPTQCRSTHPPEASFFSLFAPLSIHHPRPTARKDIYFLAFLGVVFFVATFLAMVFLAEAACTGRNVSRSVTCSLSSRANMKAFFGSVPTPLPK